MEPETQKKPILNKGTQMPEKPKAPEVGLEGMDELQLLSLFEKVKALLPAHRLPEMNLEEELILQFQHAKALMTKTHAMIETPANQKAQVLNSCNAVLSSVIKLQAGLYDNERVKIMESCLMAALKDCETAVKQRFFDRYSTLLREKTGKVAENSHFPEVN